MSDSRTVQANPIQPESLTAKISSLLRQSIMVGRLAPGRILLETNISAILGTTRTPVRFALAELEKERLIAKLPNRGFIVGSHDLVPDRSSLRDVELGIEARAGLRKERASENIYDAVESALIHCSLFGAVQVNEQELALYYRVSRTVAHDVLMLAQDNGIVKKDARSRWLTVPLDQRRVSNLYELRRQIEPLALSHAVEVIPKNKLLELERKLENTLAEYPRVSAKVLDELEIDLHVDCMSYCPNTELIEALKRTRCILIFGKHILGREISFPMEEPFIEEHLSIVRSMISGDTSAVMTHCLDHLNVAQAKIEERIGRVATMQDPIEWPFVHASANRRPP